MTFTYCKFGNFRENFIFTKSIKISHVKNPRLWHDLPTSVKDKEFSPFSEGFIFAKLHTHESKTLAKISELQ